MKIFPQPSVKCDVCSRDMTDEFVDTESERPDQYYVAFNLPFPSHDPTFADGIETRFNDICWKCRSELMTLFRNWRFARVYKEARQTGSSPTPATSNANDSHF